MCIKETTQIIYLNFKKANFENIFNNEKQLCKDRCHTVKYRNSRLQKVMENPKTKSSFLDQSISICNVCYW